MLQSLYKLHLSRILTSQLLTRRVVMANEARPCPCDLGDVFDYGAQGQEIEIKHLKAYISKPVSSSDKAVIVTHDIFGWRLPNTRFMVDLLASHGYIAICPDFFLGQKPWDPSDTEYLKADFTDWLKTRQPTNIDREVEVVLKYLKEDLKVDKIGFIGFCWGGLATHHAMLKFPELKAGVSFYGIIRDSADRYNLKNPTLFIFAENDPIIPLEQVKLLEERLKVHAKVTYKVKVFPKQTHGFAHRKREDISPEDKPYIEEARRDMITWLQEHLN